jgi:succinate-semialdehyde dehydrogenase/glutarate-semialdehyde dehydrogenase
VQKGVYDEFTRILADKTKQLVVGHGGDSKTTMGPVTTERSLDKALAQVEDAKKQGGQLVMGGNKLQGSEGYNEGYFFEPTIITGAHKDMLIAQEETFAPVMALFAFDTEEEVVKLANDTSMGLASCKSSAKWISVKQPILISYQTTSPRTSTVPGDCSRTLRLA